jgi:hypothetical protein
LHLLNHWVAFSCYFRNRLGAGVIALVVLLAAGWVGMGLMGDGGDEHPARRMLGQLQRAPLASIAAMQDESAESLVARFRGAGLQLNGDEKSLADIARINQRHPFELFEIVLEKNAGSGTGG